MLGFVFLFFSLNYFFLLLLISIVSLFFLCFFMCIWRKAKIFPPKIQQAKLYFRICEPLKEREKVRRRRLTIKDRKYVNGSRSE